jgi:hypothetical protein
MFVTWIREVPVSNLRLTESRLTEFEVTRDGFRPSIRASSGR